MLIFAPTREAAGIARRVHRPNHKRERQHPRKPTDDQAGGETHGVTGRPGMGIQWVGGQYVGLKWPNPV